MSGTRKLHIKSYGCQMNVYDSQRMTDTMAREGFVEAAAPEDADLIVLNTCHIREKAAEKVYSELGRIRPLKEGVARAERGAKVVDTEFAVEDKFARLPPASRVATRARGVTAFVTVQEGCDKFCTF